MSESIKVDVPAGGGKDLSRLPTQRRRVAERLAGLDVDNDGVISKEELVGFANLLSKRSRCWEFRVLLPLQHEVRRQPLRLLACQHSSSRARCHNVRQAQPDHGSTAS